jgi:hypothetical protein
VGEIGSERERERGKWRESVFEKVVTDDREREKVRKRERERERRKFVTSFHGLREEE